MAGQKLRKFATRLIAVVLLAGLPALSGQARALVPQIVSEPAAAPLGQSFILFVYLHSNRYARGFGGATATLSGKILSASFDGTCYRGDCTADNEGYWPAVLWIPALSAGTYMLQVTGSNEPSPPRFVFTVDGQTRNDPVPQLATVPSQLGADQASVADGYFVIPPYPGAFEFAFAPVTVSGNAITAPIYPLYCSFECPPALNYGAHAVTLPALAKGSYTLRFVDRDTPSMVYAQFPLAVNAADPVPLLGASATLLLLLLAIVSCTRLRRTL